MPGADINASVSYGLTALHVACDKGHMELVKLLINEGGC